MTTRPLRRALAAIFERLLAPGLCLTCGCEIDGAASMCDCCREALLPVRNPCRHCGQPNPVEGRVCPACLLNPPRWQRLIAPLRFDGLTRDYLHQFKYDEAMHLVKPLGRSCLAALRRDGSKPEALLPVPLHRERLRERGFNQAEEIARLWAGDLSLSLDRGALRRTRATPSQASLDAAERLQNIRGAFAFESSRRYRHVAVVDDVVTTGATVGEITRVLHRAGVKYVEVWAIARAFRD